MSTQLRLVLVLVAAAASACGDAPGDGDCSGVSLGQDSISIEENKSDTVTVTVTQEGGILSVATPEAPLTASYTDALELTATGEHQLQIGCTSEGSGRVTVLYSGPASREPCQLHIEVTCTEAPPGGGSFTNGTYEDVDGGGMIAFLGAPWFQIIQAGSAASMIYDVIRAEILLALGFYEVAVALQVAGGHPAALLAFPGLGFTADTGSGYPDRTVLDTRPVHDAIGVPGGGSKTNLWAAGVPSTRFCALFGDKTVSCYDSVGDGFEVDPSSVVDANFLEPCDNATPPVGDSKALAVASDYALVVERTGNVCHGQLGPGHQAAQAFALSKIVRGMRCPIADDGTAPLCGMASGPIDASGELTVLHWPTPSAPPTEGITIPICTAPRSVDAVRSADGSQTCFAYACSSESVAEEICLTTATGELASHTTIDLEGCNGRHAAYASDSQIGVACASSVRIFDRADMTPK